MTKGKYEDLTGRRFGMLTVMGRGRTDGNGKILWVCKCDCGNEIQVNRSSLVHNGRESCGCMQKHRRKRTEEERRQMSEARKGHSNPPSSICWSCVRSNALPGLQCIWFRSRAQQMPEGAEWEEGSNIGNSCTAALRGTRVKVITRCPQYLPEYDAKNRELIDIARNMR